MAKYSVVLQRAAAHATQAMGSITAPGSGMRRIKLYDVSFGSEATPADTAVLWTLGRCSTAGTAGTNPTPSPLDVADGACVAVAGQAHSASPTPGVVLMSQALNQRASFRWVAAPGSELVIPATASNGIATLTPTLNGGTPTISSTQLFEEQ